MLLAAKKVGDAGTFLGEAVAPTGIPSGDVRFVAGSVISIILGTVGTIFFILMVYAGYLWMTARGNDEQVGKAKKIITAAMIGIVVVVGAYAITNFITTSLIRGDASQLK
ncbi:MAG: hypothetical protein WC822_05875 [Candidatus Paceibacterota bacterium]|jgi:hypothetical protein